MNILFVTLSKDIDVNDDQSIYGSVIQALNKKRHSVFVASPTERRYGGKTDIKKKNKVTYLNIRTGNIQKTNIVEKGISTLLIESQFKRAIKKYTKNIKFDLILYTTPPITFCNVIKYFKKRDCAKTYLMLKDIFPQNAVDLGYFSNKGIIYKYFRNKEKRLYQLSDKIGCMSPANKEYVLKHNPDINKKKVEIFPNSINPNKKNIRNLKTNIKLRKKYGIPKNSTVFMYGGNIGKPQGVDHIINCLKKTKDIKNAYFIICGQGTEYYKLLNFKNGSSINNLLLINGLPKKEYTKLLNVADIGLIFLDYRFTIPNYPSRLLSYCEKNIPILCCTDPNTDIGKTVADNRIGWWVPSNNPTTFYEKVEEITNEQNSLKRCKSYLFLKENYNSAQLAKTILEQRAK